MKQKGFSLIELMVAIALGMVVIGGAIAGFMALANSSRDSLRADRLNHDLQAITDIMVAELHRAGYWDSEAPGAPTTNPFAVINTATAGCILYGYDRDLDGQVADNERYGFKLNGNAVWMRTSGTSFSDCGNGNWERVSDELGVVITNLTFTMVAKCINATKATTTDSGGCAALSPAPSAGDVLAESWHVQIQLRGQVTQDATSSKQLNAVARVRNTLKL